MMGAPNACASGPTLVRLAWAQMIFEDLCEFAAPLVVRLVSIVHASDLEQHHALMEHLISLGACRMFARTPYRATLTACACRAPRVGPATVQGLLSRAGAGPAAFRAASVSCRAAVRRGVLSGRAARG